MLLPDKTRIVRLLHRYHTWERRLLAVPSSTLARRRFEDTAYTLCILMGRRTAHEAVLAAERYVRSGSTPAPHGSEQQQRHRARRSGASVKNDT
jgi:hypothetical protein